jgi:hypothetical protein
VGAGRLIAATAPRFVLVDRLARVENHGTERLVQVSAITPPRY